jgi:hypothetical protein
MDLETRRDEIRSEDEACETMDAARSKNIDADNYLYVRPRIAHTLIPHSKACLLTLVDLAEDYNTREFCLGVVGNLRVESEDAHAAAILSGDVLVRFLDQHYGGVV